MYTAAFSFIMKELCNDVIIFTLSFDYTYIFHKYYLFSFWVIVSYLTSWYNLKTWYFKKMLFQYPCQIYLPYEPFPVKLYGFHYLKLLVLPCITAGSPCSSVSWNWMCIQDTMGLCISNKLPNSADFIVPRTVLSRFLLVDTVI